MAYINLYKKYKYRTSNKTSNIALKYNVNKCAAKTPVSSPTTESQKSHKGLPKKLCFC